MLNAKSKIRRKQEKRLRITICFTDQPHNPMVNSGAIMSASLLLYLVKPRMSLSEKFEFLQNFFVRLAGGEHVGFQNSVRYPLPICF